MANLKALGSRGEKLCNEAFHTLQGGCLRTRDSSPPALGLLCVHEWRGKKGRARPFVNEEAEVGVFNPVPV